MSDGPHRSLPMKRCWQHVAQRADNGNFAADDISAALLPALEHDCRDEMSTQFIDRVRNIIEEQQDLLIKDDVGARIEDLRGEAGIGIGRVFLDNIAQISASDVPDLIALVSAMRDALADRAARCGRQTEEHYYRKSTATRATNVRERFDAGIAGAALEGLARQILRLDARGPGRSLKRDGLDDGVALP